MGFLDNYEASRERLERWLDTYPNGRIETRIVEFSAEKGYVLVEARAYRENDMIPAGIDYAYGYQGAYQQNMKRWFVEDTVTSAIMRVQQLVMGGAERSTREIMEQVEKTPAKIANTDTNDYWTTKHGDVPSYKTAAEAEMSGTPSFGSSADGVTLRDAIAEIDGQLGGQIVEEAPLCNHGHRLWKTGKKKNGDDWAGYLCPEREKSEQCQPQWYVFGSNGKWRAK